MTTTWTAAYRVIGDESLTDDAIVYEVCEQDERNPEYPTRYRLDVTLGTSIILSCEQPGPFMPPRARDEMFIELGTLVALGDIARELLGMER